MASAVCSAMIERAMQAGVEKVYLPNIDSSSVEEMMILHSKYPDFCPVMMGLHPGSVKENYRDELNSVREWLQKFSFCAIGGGRPSGGRAETGSFA